MRRNVLQQGRAGERNTESLQDTDDRRGNCVTYLVTQNPDLIAESCSEIVLQQNLLYSQRSAQRKTKAAEAPRKPNALKNTFFSPRRKQRHRGPFTRGINFEENHSKRSNTAKTPPKNLQRNKTIENTMLSALVNPAQKGTRNQQLRKLLFWHYHKKK